MGAVPLPAPDQRGNIVGQLQRREGVVALSNGRLDGVARHPGLPLGLRVGGPRHGPRALPQFNARGLPQAEIRHEFIQLLNAHQPAYLVEKVVAAVV